MRLSALFTPNAIVVAISGLAFLIVAGALASLYGAALGPGGVNVARLSGAVVLGYAVLAWFAKDDMGSAARRAIVLGFLVAWAWQQPSPASSSGPRTPWGGPRYSSTCCSHQATATSRS